MSWFHTVGAKRDRVIRPMVGLKFSVNCKFYVVWEFYSVPKNVKTCLNMLKDLALCGGCCPWNTPKKDEFSIFLHFQFFVWLFTCYYVNLVIQSSYFKPQKINNFKVSENLCQKVGLIDPCPLGIVKIDLETMHFDLFFVGFCIKQLNHYLAMSRGNLSLGVCNQVRFKPTCPATETS